MPFTFPVYPITPISKIKLSFPRGVKTKLTDAGIRLKDYNY